MANRWQTGTGHRAEGDGPCEGDDLGHGLLRRSSIVGHAHPASSARRAPCLALAFGLAPGFAGGPEVPPELRTRAEASDFRATSTYAETLDFLRRLEARSPYFRLGVFGTSEQGRPMPFVVVSKDRAFTPEALAG